MQPWDSLRLTFKLKNSDRYLKHFSFLSQHRGNKIISKPSNSLTNRSHWKIYKWKCSPSKNIHRRFDRNVWGKNATLFYRHERLCKQNFFNRVMLDFSLMLEFSDSFWWREQNCSIWCVICKKWKQSYTDFFFHLAG